MTALTHSEMFAAAVGGIMRRMTALKGHYAAPHGDPKDSLWDIDIEGCAAELLVAKALNRYWWGSAVDSFKQVPGDVGRGQVRHTRFPNGRLVLHDSDPDDVPFVLVVGEYPHQRIAGWMVGKDGKRPEYWDTHVDRPCYMVPQSELQPIALLEEVAA